jgi:hypothetical protein
LNVGWMNDGVEQEPYCGLKFPRFPESDFKIFRGFTLDDDRLNAAVSRVGFGPNVALDARPLLSALRTEVRHRAMSEKCHTGGLMHRSNGRLFGPSYQRLRMTLV